MKPLAMLALLALAGCATGGPDYRNGPRLKPAANPSAVIAAELGFAQLAQDKGQWTAFRETATDDAEMFVPQRVNAQAWLKGKPDPAHAVKWQPHSVWSSCDGSAALTRGAWQGARGTGFFTTIWQRQKDGGYKWVLDQGNPLPQPLTAPEMIEAKVADCPKSDKDRGVITVWQALVAQENAKAGNVVHGLSTDSTLYWESSVEPDGARNTSVYMFKDGQMEQVLDSDVAAEPAG